MPTAANAGIEIFFDRAGDGEPVVFVGEAGFGGWQWGWQHAALTGPYTTIVYDHRGTGRSDSPPGPYPLETLVSDLEMVLDATGHRSAHVVGCGLGGAVGLAAARHTNCVETLTLIGTPGRESAFDLETLVADPTDRDALREATAGGLSERFRAEQPDVIDGIVDWRAEGDADLAGWDAQLAALEGFDATDWLLEVTQPTRVFHGTADDVVPVGAGRDLADGLPRGEFIALEGAGHLAHIERSREVNDVLLGVLED